MLRAGAKLPLSATVERGLGSPNIDPDAEDNESPVHDVSLAPFFLSKYEMTQAQWLRFTGEDPSDYGATIIWKHRRNTAWNPVEQVSWTMCEETPRRLGLLLPTEAQWEHAARGGTSTVWWCGNDKESIV